MKNISRFLILLLLISPFARTEEILTLNKAISQVLERNADVRAAGYRSAASRARISQAKAFEDPMVGVIFDDVPRRTADVTKSEEIDYRIDQKFPFPGKRHTRKKSATFEAEATESNSQGRIQDVLLDLKETYYETYRLDRSLELNQENQKLFKQMIGSLESSYATGQMGAEAPLRAQVELSKLDNEGLVLQQEKITHHSHLKALLNAPAHEDVQLPSKLLWTPLQKSLDQVMGLAGENRPELKSIVAMQKRDRSQLTEARETLVPDLSLGFMYGQRPLAPDTWTGSASINLPLFFWSKNRARIQEAKASLKATEAELDSMKVHTLHDIEGAYEAVKSSEKILENYEKRILPQAKVTLDVSQQAYASGKMDFRVLIDAARTYKDLQMSYFESQARLGKSWAMLERLVGIEIPQNKPQRGVEGATRAPVINLKGDSHE